jgi:phosphatidylglycerol---prolipoprotein diacylglyceryl transferase
MLHQMSPYAIQLWDGFGIRWYGLSYLAGFFAAYLVFVYFANRNLTLIPKHLLSDFVFAVAIGTVVGGRLGYCIFYSPDLFTRFTTKLPFWGVLAVNEGGMASHGGIVGIIVACIIFAKKHNFDWRHAVDLCALTGPIGVFFGRIANYINGELVGRPCSQAFSWCVRFPQDILAWPQHSVEKLSSLNIVLNNLGVSTEDWQKLLEKFLFNKQAWIEVDRYLNMIIFAVQEKHSAVSAQLAPLLELRHPSQLYEAFLEGIFLFTVLFLLWARARRPGVITGAFLTLYSIVRVIGEQFRMPDAHIGFQALELTRGQWLSIVMFMFGALFLILFVRKNATLVGGWFSKQPKNN